MADQTLPNSSTIATVTPAPLHLTLKKRAQLKHVLAGESVREASIAAGYSSKSVGTRALKDTRAKLMEAMDRYCLTDQTLVRDYLLPLLNATQTSHAQYEGKFTDYVEDPNDSIRLAALRETFKLRGAYPKEDANVGASLNILINNVAVTE